MSAGRWIRLRIAACGAGFLVLFATLGSRAYDLQIKERDRLRGLAEEQYLREIELPPRRGRVLDRNGAELASTADVDSVYCNPRQLPDPEAAATSLARALGLDRAELARRLSQKRFFAWVKRTVTPDEAAAVKGLGLPGVGFAREPQRFYPNRTLAATVMGSAGSDGHGLDGVELAYDRYLAGSSSSVQGIRDALGRDLLVDGVTEAAAGQDVVLTLDRYLTFITERALLEAVDRHQAKAAISITLDPRTGEVLAMASVPTYDPNRPGGAALVGARNRAITDAFEPGSTMKTFTISAALDAGAVRPDDRFDCMMGRMMVGKYQIHDTHPNGVLTVADIFKHSSNIGAAKIARRLGREKLAEAFHRFGFGSPTGIGLPGERGGVIRPVARWGDIGSANAAFGQGLTVTPLQLACGVAAIAADGIYHPPRIVSRVVDGDGRSERMKPPPPRRVMSEEAARMMTGIMRGVTEAGGTARRAAIPGYPVAGKTGTAQKVAHGRYDPTKWVASFIGFAPADAPRVATIVLIDEPQGTHLGGSVAAPVWKEIVEQTLRYLHVPPSERTAAADGEAAPAKEDEAEDPGSDENPGSEVAAASSEEEDDPGPAEPDASQAAGGADAAIPDFTGMTIARAVEAAERSGIEIEVEGSGVARSQQPEPGPAHRGASCRVFFAARE